MSALQAIAPDLWVTSVPHQFAGLHVGTRMTVVRLPSGKVLLHSLIAISDALRQDINAIGSVQHIICPNLFHHMYAGHALTAFPEALLHGPAKLQRKRKDLTFDAVLSNTAHPDWGDALVPLTIRGSLLHETLFIHRPSRTLISCDLVENFKTCPHRLTRWYLQLGGILGKVGWHPLLRIVYLNRRKAREDINKMLAIPFDRVILSHGELITENAQQAVRDGLAWLL